MTRLYQFNNETLNFDPLHDYEYRYSFIFTFEHKYYSRSYVTTGLAWMRDYWWLSIVYSAVYVALVYAGQMYMRTREKFHVHRSLVAWNIVLAIFSVLGMVRFLPHFFTILSAKGYEHSICVIDYNFGVAGCWAWLFILSKLVELIDTAFIVLRKQKLIFLHWYHHATVLIYCWYSVHDNASSGRWFIAMNYTVHSLMYTYYACRALRYNIPKYINICITSMQLSQMLIGIWVNTVAYMRKSRGDSCDVPFENIYWSFFMYFTYFVLFFHFFIQAYFKKSSASAAASIKAKQNLSKSIGHEKIMYSNHMHNSNGNVLYKKND